MINEENNQNDNITQLSNQKLTGRGGKNNFGNNTRALVKSEEDRKLVRNLLEETLVAYKQTKVKSDDELIERFDEYFTMCAISGQVPTVEEMCLFTGYTSGSIWDMENGRLKGFSSSTAAIIKKAKFFMQTFDAKMVTSGTLNFLAYCFRAKNYYGMVDKQEYVITPNNPLGDDIDPTTLAEKYRKALPPATMEGE